MLIQKDKASIARVEVQQRFCDSCSIHIKNELKEIKEVENIRLYPDDYMITFSFSGAYVLSVALNKLKEIGYNENNCNNYGNKIKQTFCFCKKGF